MKKREIIFDSYFYIFPAISTTANPSMSPWGLPSFETFKISCSTTAWGKDDDDDAIIQALFLLNDCCSALALQSGKDTMLWMSHASFQSRGRLSVHKCQHAHEVAFSDSQLSWASQHKNIIEEEIQED